MDAIDLPPANRWRKLLVSLRSGIQAAEKTDANQKGCCRNASYAFAISLTRANS
jgi:hypothetical protein